MKPMTLIAAAALSLFGAAAMAQTQGEVREPALSGTQSQTPTESTLPGLPVPPQDAPASATTPVQPQTPAPIVVESRVDLTTEPSPPADPNAARQEAVNALHWAKTEGCRNEPSPRECLQRAQEDYRSALEQLDQQPRR